MLDKKQVFLWMTVTLVFSSGLILMGYEIIAARMVAPLLGNSIYTWTTIIGMVLIGITLGTWLGGWASKRSLFFLLPYSYLVAAITIGGSILIQPVLHHLVMQSSLGLISLALIISAILTLIQTLALSFGGPLFMRLITHSLDQVGFRYSILSVAGSLGSIVGIFLSGLVLVPLLGVPGSVIVATLFCLLLALLAMVFPMKKIHTIIVSVAALCISGIFFLIFSFSGSRVPDNQLGSQTSPYYHIHVYDHPFGTSTAARWLFLDFDSHSIDTGTRQNGLYTDIAYIIKDLMIAVQSHASIGAEQQFSQEDVRILVLGAGAYTIPKIISNELPNSNIDVIEIDPALEEVANNFFNLSHYDNINTITGDPRYLLPKNNHDYRVIFGDVYHSFISVPSHLTTVEFFETIHEHLSKDGLYFMSFIATQEGEGQRIIQHMTATAEEVFRDVRVVSFAQDPNGVASFVLLASPSVIPYSHTEIDGLIRSEISGQTHINTVPVNTNGIRPFTDAWQPLDSLMRPVIKQYFQGYKEVYYDVTG